MPVEIRVPALGESVVEATISRWMRQPGDTVTIGDALAELETDKVNVEVPAEASGVLGTIVHGAGETVAVGAIIGTIAESAAAPVKAEPVKAAPTDNGHEAASHSTPMARGIAAANNVDLGAIQGSLPGGRIGKDDVLQQTVTRRQVVDGPAPEAPPAPVSRPNAGPAAPSPVPVSTGRPEERIRMTRRRQTIAARLVEAQQTAAMLTTFNEVDMSAVMELRKRRKESFEKRFGVGLGFMSFFTRASVGALKQFPYVNAEIQGDEIVLKSYYDIGIAVGVPEGLVVPVVRDADRMSFAQIEKKIKDLAAKARDNKLTLSELQGGTFTITNGGVYGSLMSTPILNTPQVGILGLHAIKERPIVVAGEIVIRPMMYLALSYDHRLIDGGTAVSFLVRIKELIEDPESLLLEG